MTSKAVQAGPLLLVLDRTRDGDFFVSFHATKGDRVIRTFNVYGRHLRRNPEAIRLLEVFLEVLKGGANGDGQG